VYEIYAKKKSHGKCRTKVYSFAATRPGSSHIVYILEEQPSSSESTTMVFEHHSDVV
jgi:hypothetical protein